MKRTIVLVFSLFMLSGCYMLPMAFVTPAVSNFSTASIIQSTITSSANYMVKKTTGKTISDHIIEAINDDIQQTLAADQKIEIILPKSKPRT